MGDSMSTIKANDIQNASGGIPTVKGQRLIPTAWVNFNGTGTVAIGDSENVSSITDVAAGQTTVTFTTAMATIYYAAVVSSNNGVTDAGNADYVTTKLVGSCKVRTGESGTFRDAPDVNLIILGGQA